MATFIPSSSQTTSTSASGTMTAIHDFYHRFSPPGATLTRSFIAGMVVAVALGNAQSAITADVLRAIPFVVPSAMTVQTMSVYITTGVSPGSGWLAIYENTSNNNLYPSGLLGFGGNFDLWTPAEISGGLQLDKVLYPDRVYWAVHCSSGNTPGLRFIQNQAMYPIYGVPDFTGISVGIQHNYTYTESPPDPFPAGASASTGVYPAIRILTY